MQSYEIRKKFLEFFLSKGHTVVKSDSVVPKDDPTVLFTTAGMQQFKQQFLGNIDEYSRAATSQKCIRTDDLCEVGNTAFHHTFFEMLGNFSFGDYFKKEAITWAWEFLTEVVNIPAEKLWVSVYKDDEEAERIWLDQIKVPSDRLVKLGDKSNFWPSDAKNNGPNGPCGPCSEIFYDYGVNADCKSDNCDPDCDCGRFSEIWNLVFTQFNRQDGGVLEPLPNKNIDTGMGLERLTAVLQGKENNFDTDFFSRILAAIDAELEVKGAKVAIKEKRVIADHMRAIVFGIADGVNPSNEGRGYVIRKLIINIASLLPDGCDKEPLIYKLVPSVVETMQDQYPELVEKAQIIADIIRNTEKSYIETKKERLPAFRKQIQDIFESNVSNEQKSDDLGELIFKYKDTYGLPVPVMVAAMDSVSFSKEVMDNAMNAYEKLMLQQQEQSRASSKMTGDVFTNMSLNLDVEKTQFNGYSEYKSQVKVLQLFKDDNQIDNVTEKDNVKVLLDKSPFYAESGGQVGDTGYINNGENKIRINNTVKVSDIFIHEGIVEAGSFSVGDSVTAEIDVNRRLSIMRNHTATHILQAALRNILGDHVQQQGSFVSEDRLRFDFTHPKAVKKEQLAKIENFVNSRSFACDSVNKEVMSIEDANKKGALAFFEEKYGDTVRVVAVGDYSKELCGGTHLDSTGQIGMFKIVNESAIAQGIRRIEAVTGFGALELIGQNEKRLDNIAQLLKSPVNEVCERVDIQIKKVKQLEKELEKYRVEAIKNQLDSIIDSSSIVNDVRIVSHIFNEIDINILRKVSDLLKQKLETAVVILGSKSSGNTFILCTVTDSLVDKGIKANELIQKISPIINGSGGGRPSLAQAGSKDASKIEKAMHTASQLCEEKIKEIMVN